MNIHEHQAKALLKEYGAPVASGVAIFSADEAEAAAKEAGKTDDEIALVCRRVREILSATN